MNLAFDHPTTDLESRVIDDHHAVLAPHPGRCCVELARNPAPRG